MGYRRNSIKWIKSQRQKQLIFIFILNKMSLSYLILLYGFLLFYALDVLVNGFTNLYLISCNIEDRQKEVEKELKDKNSLSESIKHLYS